jgi:hypothetical protein
MAMAALTSTAGAHRLRELCQVGVPYRSVRLIRAGAVLKRVNFKPIRPLPRARNVVAPDSGLVDAS